MRRWRHHRQGSQAEGPSRVGIKLKNVTLDDLGSAERTGVHVVRVALEVPTRQIARNAGIDEGPVVDKVRAATGFFGFDARTKTFGDLDELGIIDPTKVVRIALENAVGVAGTLLLAEATLVEIEEPADRTTPTGFE